MREVERASVLDVGPADAWDASLAQPRRAPRHEAESLHASVLLRPVERQLEAEADAQDRCARVEPRAQRVVVAARAQTVHRRARRADAGQHCEVCAADVVGDRRAEPAERDLDGAHVPGAVAADRDVHRRPFVDGTPVPEVATAAASARPTALNAASATWCASCPDASTWMFARAACARLVSMCAAIPGSHSRRSSAYGRPPRSTAARASASSIGTTALP